MTYVYKCMICRDRDVARIAVVDEDESTVFDAYVKPSKAIVSYLTKLTGITAK
jgi:RNA exonuclease 4